MMRQRPIFVHRAGATAQVLTGKAEAAVARIKSQLDSSPSVVARARGAMLTRHQSTRASGSAGPSPARTPRATASAASAQRGAEQTAPARPNLQVHSCRALRQQPLQPHRRGPMAALPCFASLNPPSQHSCMAQHQQQLWY